MKARDVMVSPVITVKPTTLVKDVARIFLERQISAVPVVDDEGRIVGIVSEGDLLHRHEAGTERKRSWWLRLFTDDAALAADYTKAHARKVGDVMKRNVITASPEAELRDIAMLLEKHAIKRVPIVREGQLVGILSRANLIQAVASSWPVLQVSSSDEDIRDRVLAHLQSQPWAHTSLLNATVNGGVVDLWGLTVSDAGRTAIRVAAESIPGVRTVNDNLTVRPGALAAY
jgi:CBS domain-containing protein